MIGPGEGRYEDRKQLLEHHGKLKKRERDQAYIKMTVLRAAAK
jgi:hypothetical protein